METHDEANKQGGSRALRLITIVVVSFTFYDLLQFQQSFYSTTKVTNGDYLNGQRDLQADANLESRSKYIPLPSLVRADEEVDCPDGVLPAPILSNATADSPTASQYKIPRIVHQTAEGKCFTQTFYDNAKAWSFEGAGFSFYFHDRKAKHTLLEKHWPVFPQLQNAFLCLQNAGGAAVADLWRYLALWEYGGFYTDMDNKPGPLLNASTVNTIFAADLDAVFFQDRVASPKFPTQYFFGVAPKHPMMFFAVHQVLVAMLDLQEVGTFYVPETTGPSALDRAFLQFMNVPKKEWRETQRWLNHPMTKPSKGTYTGYRNRTVTILANADEMLQYVRPKAIKGREKVLGWKAMGNNDYEAMNTIPQNKTCLQVIMDQHLERLGETG